MSCEAYADAILDLARGVGIDEGTRVRIEGHLAQCPRCAGRLRQEQALTADFAGLAKSLLGARPSGSLEPLLLEAFHHRHAPSTLVADRLRSHWRAWLAAAAAIVLAATAMTWRGAPRITNDGGSHSPRLAATAASPTGAPAAMDSSHVPSPTGPRRPPRSARAASRIIRPTGFVALPGAASLPEFESGTIQRVALSLSSLPAYGVDIAPDASVDPIEADLLVGQDGQPRAIRLVAAASASASRSGFRSRQ
jgi:hypothetical protein